jgi:hypothetical protein
MISAVKLLCNFAPEMKRIALIILLLCPLLIVGQTYTNTIRGRVLDADSKSPVPGANVILLNSDTLLGSVTDANGSFRLDHVPVGRKAIKVSFVGYGDAVLNNLILSSGKELVLTIELQEKVYESEAVEVVAGADKTRANNDLVTVSSRNFQAEETNRYAGSRGDPSKMVANYAGVASGNDARNDIIVRGNSPLGVLWRLEGVDIPNPNHFSAQGATGGPISMLNNNVLGNSDFLTSAFPAEYGNKTAAVFDIRLRNGNNEKTEFTGQLGINGIELGAEGPISKKNGSSYLVNYRYSTLEVFNKLGIRFGVSASPEYQDVSYKLNIPTKKAGIFQFWGIGGTGKLQLLDSELKPDDWSYIAKGEDLVFKSSMGAGGLTHLYFFNSNVSGRLALSVSASDLDASIDTLSTVDRSPFLRQKNKSTEGNVIASYTLTDKINSRHLIKTGVSGQMIYFNARSFEYNTEYGKYLDQLNVSAATSTLLQAYAHWQFRATERFTVNTGAHYQNYLLNNSWAIEPRLGLRYQLSDKQSLNAGYGMHSQMQPTIYYFYDTYIPATDSYYRSNKNLDLSRSQHAVLSYDYNFMKDFRLKLETYYQYLYNIPVQQNWNSSFSMINVGNALEGIPLVDTLVNQGDGENYGLEITIEKFFSKQFYFLVTASVYDSKYRGQNGVTHNTSYNGNYVANALAGYELLLGKSRNRAIALDLKYTQAGGNRYTPIDLEASRLAGMAVYRDDQAFSKKQMDYSRFDVKLSLRSNRKRISHSFFVVVENIFDRKNILRETYNDDIKDIQKEYQLGLFPYFGYRIEF